VMAARNIELKAQVSGEIVKTDANWIEGGRLAEGTTILELEQADHRIGLQRAEAELAQAQSELALEMGRQDVAKREWELLGEEEDPRDLDLALRVPQLKSARARVAAAKARVEQALLSLERTEIKAPFNALVVMRRVNRGDQASPQSSLGTLVGTDAYHARVSIPVDQLKWVELPSRNQQGSEARVYLPDGSVRDGRVIRLLGDLEPRGRMARLLVEVLDPANGDPPMLLDSYVRVEIEGRTIPKAYLIGRDRCREGGEIWLLKPDNSLRIAAVHPIWSDRESVIIRADIQPGERLITSDLSAAIDGMALRVEGEP